MRNRLEPDCWNWLMPGRFVLLLCLMTLATHLDVALALKTFVARDFGALSYPMAMYHRESVLNGEAPLWDPYTECGTPFLAIWNTATLYPLTLLYILLPMPWAMNVLSLLHQVVAGLGMYFLAFRWTRHRLSAAFAGVAFAFGGVTESLLVYAGHGAAWMPWMLWLGERAWRLGGRAVLWAVLAGSLQMLSGLPEPVFFTWVMLGMLWCFQVIRNPRDWKVRFFRFGGTAFAIAAISSAQLIPFLDLLAHSQRAAGSGTPETGALAAGGVANLLVPMYNVSRVTMGLAFQGGQVILPSYYFGITVLALGLWSVCAARSGFARCLAILAAFAVWLAMGESAGMLKLIHTVFPVTKLTRFPVKYIIVTAVIAPLLAAQALGAWMKAQGEIRVSFARWGGGILGAFGFAILGLVIVAKNKDSADVLQSGVSRAAFLAGCALLIWAIPRLRADKARNGMALTLLAFVWLDPVTSVPAINPTANCTVFATPGPAVMTMKPAPTLGQSRAMTPFRVQEELKRTLPSVETSYLYSRLGLSVGCHLLDHIPIFGGFYPLQPAVIGDVKRTMVNSNGIVRDCWADFLGVNQVITSETNLDWHFRPSALPIVTSGQQPVFLTKDDALAFLSSSAFIPDKYVVLPIEAREIVSSKSGAAQISALQFGAHQISFSAQSEQPSMVVIAQTYYHWWEASVDGCPTRLWSADYGFQAIEVPAGQHQVRLVYRDLGFQAGVAISLASVAGWGLCFLLFGRGSEDRKRTCCFGKRA